MKTVKTSKVNVAICWNGLKNTAPKQFSSLGEMEKAGAIIELMGDSIPEFVEILKAGEKLSLELRSGAIPPEEMMAKKAEYEKKTSALETKSGSDVVDLGFEDDLFNTFFQQFEKWGKDWFTKLEPLLTFRKALNETNGQKKGK